MTLAGILFNVLFFGLFALAIFLHRKRAGGTYYDNKRAVLYGYGKWFGLGFAILSGLIFVIDLAFALGTGDVANLPLLVLVSLGFIAGGILLWRVFGSLRRSERNVNP